jgi:hypothetical protein
LAIIPAQKVPMNTGIFIHMYGLSIDRFGKRMNMDITGIRPKLIQGEVLDKG